MADQKRKFVVKKKLTISKTYRAWDEWSVGDIALGAVVGEHHDEKYGKVSPIIKVEEAFFKKDGPKFVGKNLVLNACGQLTKNYPKITVGDILQVEYTGKGTMEKGKYAGQEAHTVQVDLMGDADEVESTDEDTSDDDL